MWLLSWSAIASSHSWKKAEIPEAQLLPNCCGGQVRSFCTSCYRMWGKQHSVQFLEVEGGLSSSLLAKLFRTCQSFLQFPLHCVEKIVSIRQRRLNIVCFSLFLNSKHLLLLLFFPHFQSFASRSLCKLGVQPALLLDERCEENKNHFSLASYWSESLTPYVEPRGQFNFCWMIRFQPGLIFTRES